MGKVRKLYCETMNQIFSKYFRKRSFTSFFLYKNQVNHQWTLYTFKKYSICPVTPCQTMSVMKWLSHPARSEGGTSTATSGHWQLYCRSSKQAVMKIGEEHITGSHQIVTPRPSFYSPVNYPPCSPSPFSTFHSPAKERTSPEGSSCGEADMESGGHIHELNSQRSEEDKPSS